MSSWKIEGMKELIDTLNRMPKDVRQSIDKKVRKGADELVKEMKKTAPVKSGALRDSIRVEAGDQPLTYVVKAGGEKTTKPVRDGAKATYDYSLGIEFGTVDTERQAFFYPSYRKLSKRIKRRIDRELTTQVKAAWEKT